MKKLIAVVLALVFCLSFASCDFGGGKETTDKEGTANEEQLKAEIKASFDSAVEKTKKDGASFSASITFAENNPTLVETKYNAEYSFSGDNFMITFSTEEAESPLDIGLYYVDGVAYLNLPFAKLKTTADKEEYKSLFESYVGLFTEISGELENYVAEASKNYTDDEKKQIEEISEAVSSLISMGESLEKNYIASPKTETVNGVKNISFEISKDTVLTVLNALNKIEASDGETAETITSTDMTVKINMSIDANGYLTKFEVVCEDPDGKMTFSINANTVGEGTVITAPTDATKYKNIDTSDTARDGIYENIQKTLDRIDEAKQVNETITVSVGVMAGAVDLSTDVEVRIKGSEGKYEITIPANETYNTKEIKFIYADGMFCGKVGSEAYKVAIEESEKNYENITEFETKSLMKLFDSVTLRSTGTGSVGTLVMYENKGSTLGKFLSNVLGANVELGAITAQMNFDGEGIITDFSSDVAILFIDDTQQFEVESIKIGGEVSVSDTVPETQIAIPTYADEIASIFDLMDRILAASFAEQ